MTPTPAQIVCDCYDCDRPVELHIYATDADAAAARFVTYALDIENLTLDTTDTITATYYDSRDEISRVVRVRVLYVSNLDTADYPVTACVVALD